MICSPEGPAPWASTELTQTHWRRPATGIHLACNYNYMEMLLLLVLDKYIIIIDVLKAVLPLCMSMATEILWNRKSMECGSPVWH